MPEICVKKFAADPKFKDPISEGKYERDLRIDRDMRKADKAVYDVVKDRCICFFVGLGGGIKGSSGRYVCREGKWIRSEDADARN